MLSKILSFIAAATLSLAAWGAGTEAILFTPVLYILLQATFHPYKYCSSRRRTGFLFNFFCYEGRKPLHAVIMSSVAIATPIAIAIMSGPTLWAVLFGAAVIGVVHNQVW